MSHSFYKDILTKFAGNVYGYENMSEQWVHVEKQNGRYSQSFENYKDLWLGKLIK